MLFSSPLHVDTYVFNSMRNRYKKSKVLKSRGNLQWLCHDNNGASDAFVRMGPSRLTMLRYCSHRPRKNDFSSICICPMRMLHNYIPACPVHSINSQKGMEKDERIHSNYHSFSPVIYRPH